MKKCEKDIDLQKEINKLLLLEYADLMSTCVLNLCMEKICENETLWFKKLLYDFDFLIPHQKELKVYMNSVDIDTLKSFYQYLSNVKYPKAAFEVIKEGTFMRILVNYMGELGYYPLDTKEIPADYPLGEYLRRNLPNDITKKFLELGGKFYIHPARLESIKYMEIPKDLKKKIRSALNWKPKYHRKYEDFPL